MKKDKINIFGLLSEDQKAKICKKILKEYPENNIEYMKIMKQINSYEKKTKKGEKSCNC